jgi:hypothetical protein
MMPFREPADIEVSVSHLGPTAQGDLTEGATSQAQAATMAADSRATSQHLETMVVEPHAGSLSPKDKAPTSHTVPAAVPETVVAEAPPTNEEARVSPRRTSPQATGLTPAEAVPRVTPSGSSEESSGDTETVFAEPSPRAEQTLQASLQPDLPESSNPLQVEVHAGVPASAVEVDVEAFRVEADSLKARYEVRHQTGNSPLMPFAYSDFGFAETCPIPAGQAPRHPPKR